MIGSNYISFAKSNNLEQALRGWEQFGFNSVSSVEQDQCFVQEISLVKNLQSLGLMLIHKQKLGIFPGPKSQAVIMRALNIYNEFELCIRFFNLAHAINLCSAEMYRLVIQAIYHSALPDIKMTVCLIHEAIYLGMVDALIFAGAIEAIARSRKPSLAFSMQLLGQAKLMGFASDLVYKSCLNVLAHLEVADTGLAESLIAEGHLLAEIYQFQGQSEIDFHGASYGQVYFALRLGIHELLVKEENQASEHAFRIIYGRGLHSNLSKQGHHPIKQALLAAVKHFALTRRVQGEEDKKNPGLYHLRILPKAKLLSEATCTLFAGIAPTIEQSYQSPSLAAAKAH